MIPIRLLNGSTIFLNSDLVESVVSAHDTIITLTSGRKIVASSSPREILDAVVAYRQRCQHQPLGRGRSPCLPDDVRPQASRESGGHWDPPLQAPPDTTPQTHPLHA